MKRLVTKVFDRWTGLFMQEIRRSTKKKQEGSRVAVDLVREREREMSICIGVQRAGH